MISDTVKKVANESFYAPDARIMAVDDTAMNLIVFESFLKQTGIQIDTADSGKECLILAEKNKYHLIFLDVRMPEMDGIETLHRLRIPEGSKNKDTPVIALTANTDAGARDEHIKQGFSDYLSKPVDKESLMKIILEYLPGELVQETKAEEKAAHISDSETERITGIPGLEMALGIRSCGTAGLLEKALKEFYLTANDRIQEIEYYIHTENYNDYTIKVHALKSTARLVGAEKLSEMARYLEECGDRNDIGEINRKTAELTEHFRELAEAIGTYLNKKEDKCERPVIEWGSFMDALRTIYEFVEVFDFDSADSIMEMLDGYAIPAEYCEATQKLKVMLIDVKRDDIMRHIDEMEKRTHPEPAEGGPINIPDIDVKSAVEALGGSVEDYIKILKVFTDDEKERLRQMDECIGTENIELYTVFAHSLKSSAAIIGSAELSEFAKKVEAAGKQGNFEYVRENHNELLQRTNRVIDDLKCFLQQYGGGDEQEKEQGNKEFLLKSLKKMEAALKDYDINTAEEALTGLSKMQWGEAVSRVISEIGQKVMSFDYDEAEHLVNGLLKMAEKEEI